MIEKTVYDYLAEQLDVPVFLELPEVPSEDYPEWPDRFVVIEKIGGSVVNHIHTASIAVQSYSISSLFGAASLDKTVCDAMEGLTVIPNVGSCRLASNYNFTDTRTKRYRYQCVFEIAYVR